MATYYVCSSTGSDANNGLGPDASAVTNKPWLTIGKALGAAGISSGDTVYIGPGTYREVVTVAMTSAVAETSLLGDPGNAQGFKTAAGVLVSPAEVIWTAYTTNDKTVPSATSLLNFAGRDFLTFQFITFVLGSNAIGIDAKTTLTSTDITFKDCTILDFYPTNHRGIRLGVGFGISANWLIDRCIFCCGSAGVPINIELTSAGAGADYDANIIFRNSRIISTAGTTFLIANLSALAFRGGGVVLRNITGSGGTTFMSTAATFISTTFPCTVTNSFISGATGLSAGTAGQITENYNINMCSTTLTNVTAGANSINDYSYAPLLQFGQEYISGMQQRPYGEPMNGSPLLGFGNDGSQTAYDGLNRLRPAGGASALPAAGWLDRGNTFTKETGTVRTGTNAISITGPGYQDFQLPVDATSTTATVYVRWDATYAGTKPLVKVLNGGECGVTDATATATGASGSWEQLSLSFTPARVGIVTIRLQSSDTNGAGVMYADDFNVT
jgi:hypothetical protein